MVKLPARAAVVGSLAALAAAPVAEAATSASGTQAITGEPVAALTATFPGNYVFGTFAPGTNTSAQQVLNVKSNLAWGVRISSDEASGYMRRWTGSAYLATPLASALNWRLTALGGVAQGSTSYASLSSTPSTVIGGQAATGDGGVDVGVTYQQAISFGDDLSGTYRIVVTYAAAQGF